MATTQIRYPSVLGIIDASGNLATITGGALNVNIASGTITVGTPDKTAFTYGTTSESPVGGVYQDTSPSLTAGTTGAVRLTQNRAFHVNLRDASGNQLLGQAVAAASIPVVLPSDTGTIPVNVLGLGSANAPVVNNYGSTSITTGAYVQLVASTTSTCQEVEIFDSSGQSLYLATGGMGSEVNQMIIFPGGNGRVRLQIPAGTRVSAKAISANATTGSLYINFYGP